MKILINVCHDLFYYEWENILRENNFPKKVSGIYKLIKFDKNNNRENINRLIDFDSQGIIYIGKSINLTSRLGILINLLNRKSVTQKHIMGQRYIHHELLQKRLLVENLKLEIEFCDNPREREIELIDEYLKKHGEIPPLNYSS